jgi:hypothetical protein
MKGLWARHSTAAQTVRQGTVLLFCTKLHEGIHSLLRRLFLLLLYSLNARRNPHVTRYVIFVIVGCPLCLLHLSATACKEQGSNRSNPAPTIGTIKPQSRQSAKLFLKSSELGLPQLLQLFTRRRVCRFWGGRAHSLAREKLGESQFRRRDIQCGTLYTYVYIYVLF